MEAAAVEVVLMCAMFLSLLPVILFPVCWPDEQQLTGHPLITLTQDGCGMYFCICMIFVR